jgi:hypothetical protein
MAPISASAEHDDSKRLCGIQHENLTAALVLSPADGMAVEHVPANGILFLPGGACGNDGCTFCSVSEQTFETAAARDSALDQ